MNFPLKISDLELLREEPSSHFYSHRNVINIRYQMSSTVNPITPNISDSKTITNTISHLSQVHTTIIPKWSSASKIPYRTTPGNTGILNKQNDKVSTKTTTLAKNTVNHKTYRKRVLYSNDINTKKINENVTTTNQPIPVNRQQYFNRNTTKISQNQAFNNYEQTILKQFYENNKNLSKIKVPQESKDGKAETKFISQKINIKNEVTPSTKWKYIDNIIPTTFKPAKNIIQPNRIDNNVNSTSPFINTNQINVKHKIRNKKVSQFKSKNRQSKDYDYNYYEDISENVSPEYDFIEFKKIK